MCQSKEIIVRAKAFSCETGARKHMMRVDCDGTVRVYDNVAGHYTLCHSMSERVCKRIRQLAGL